MLLPTGLLRWPAVWSGPALFLFFVLLLLLFVILSLSKDLAIRL